MGTGMEDGAAKLDCVRLRDVECIEVWLAWFVFGNVRSKDSFNLPILLTAFILSTFSIC